MKRAGLCSALLLCFASTTSAAQAATPERQGTPARPQTAQRSPAQPASQESNDEELEADPLATGLAIFPGAIVHGTGHFVAGRSETGRRLLLTEGIGLGLVLLGGGTLALTGAARDWVGPAAAVTIGGAGLVGLSFLADVWGVAMPDSWRSNGGGKAYSTSRIGVSHVSDPQFAYERFLTAGFEQWLGPVRIAPSGYFGLDSQNERLRLALAPRVLGATPGRPARDGSFVDVEVALTRHDFPSEGFLNTTFETSVLGRMDLQHFAPDLRGSFAEMGVGWGITRTAYDIRGLNGATIEPDYTELLLFQLGFGAYFRGDRGEWRAYYDHRHDDYAAGLLLHGLGSGVAGHFGLDVDYYFKSRLLEDRLGVGFNAEVGSAYILGLSLLYREEM
ncbi:MAG: hypothetical protein H6718_18265 [Polyangiaceae bacterium]|nr:hypothetical protein [Myxococcales bacterium]MCB9587351.1 hypothetical protein [Polyangiaceae bacterium]MCB9605852.1 hypothetical protein [Polyangiaceae bacterium]